MTKTIIDKMNKRPVIAGITRHILCANNRFPFFSCNKRMKENPQVIKITMKNNISILGSINLSTNEKNFATCRTNTLFRMSTTVNPMTISI